MDELAARTQRAVEVILENEGLTGDLGDEAAKLLLDWGAACARAVAGSTSGLGEAEAEEVLTTRLKALRRLVRLANKWATNRAEGGPALLSDIAAQAAIIYGAEFTPLGDEQMASFLQRQTEHTANPTQLIANLRQLFENVSNS